MNIYCKHESALLRARNQKKKNKKKPQPQTPNQKESRKYAKGNFLNAPKITKPKKNQENMPKEIFSELVFSGHDFCPFPAPRPENSSRHSKKEGVFQ